MPRTRQLHHLYCFPGFESSSQVHGIFGDPLAVVVSLKRRRKKRYAAPVAKSRGCFTISDRAGSVTCPVATNGFISTSSSAGSNVPGVVP